jgi:putative membrane protein
MLKLLIHWLLSAITLLVISHYLPGFHVFGLEPALVAALVIGLLNATLGLVLKIVTFPITIITLGLFLLVINAAMILLASHLVTGFHVTGWIPALWGAVALALVGIVVHAGSKKI